VSHLIDRDQLIGDNYQLPISLILVHSDPGTRRGMHRDPCPEVFVIESGRATFRVDNTELVGEAGQIVIAPANAYHGFTNTGSGELCLTAIHTAPAFSTEWLADPDAGWLTSRGG
jgi:mannose-6-phosphate isomerase-like protein (cupin superfamily)